MDKKERILMFITYYKLQKRKQKGVLIKAICDKCDFNGGTFAFRMEKQRYSEAEIDAIEIIIEKHKKGEPLSC